MKTEAHRHWPVGAGDQRYFQGWAVGAKHRCQLEPVAERENREEVAANPIEPSCEAILPRFGQLPSEQGPRHAVHRKPVLVEVQEWR